MRRVRWITWGWLALTPLLVGAGARELLVSPPSTGAPTHPPPRSPSLPNRAAAPDRPEWSDPRSLLDDSRPPSAANPQAQEAWRQRDLPQLDQMRHEMDLRNQPDFNRQFIDDLDWYFAGKGANPPRPLPKPPEPPRSEPKIGDVTPFDLVPGPSTQPTTRPAE